MISHRTRRFQRQRLIYGLTLLVLVSCVALEFLRPGWMIFPGIRPAVLAALVTTLVLRLNPINMRRLRAFARLNRRKDEAAFKAQTKA